MRREDGADPQWVADLSGVDLAAARAMVDDAERERRLFSHLVQQHEQEGRKSYVEIDAPWELYALTRILRPRHIVEVGVSSGVSSAYFLRALELNGRGTLHSIDLPSFPSRSALRRRRGGASWSLPPNRSSGWAVPRRLQEKWDLRLGDKADVLPALTQELPAVDLFLYDVPHDDADATREFGSVDPLFRKGSVAIVDHGPHGDLCLGLRRWARKRGATPRRRTGLGLFGMRNPAS